ncbi:MAG: hypothetical protein EOO88_18760 [Pedobacter sp.]|nr:MAG: hypothetical protein EOO88_18760 [Pedobacter sp.]
MFPLCDLGPATLNPAVQVFFSNGVTVKDGVVLFFYQDQQGNLATEYWGPVLHLVPVSSGIWLVHEGFAVQVRHLFISGSAADILCFCQFNPGWLKDDGTVAFAALGLLPNAAQIGFLKGRFPNAKVHTLFESGVTGRVTDCKVALWQKGKDASFRVSGDLVEITYKSRRYKISLAVLSLNRFETTASIRSKIRTHKPNGCLGSYHEFFVSNQNRR